MKILFLAHSLSLGSQSMPRFAAMLAKGMSERGYQTEIVRPSSFFGRFHIPKLNKWLNYIDQFILFPLDLKKKIRKGSDDTLYVVTDHALGPYVPLVSNKPHVIHCHDFLAQRSALGEIPENITSSSGRTYQQFIRNGYSKGKNFICVSEKTRADLHEFLKYKPEISEMVYNGLSAGFKPSSKVSSRQQLSQILHIDLSNGYILHVGGNQWYKNRIGVIEIYNMWRAEYNNPVLPLVLIGQKPSNSLINQHAKSPFKSDIYCLSGLSDELVKLSYTGASVFLFPSLAEGFGWPIAEAMASGTLVITTNEAPMLEVAGDAASLVEKMPFKDADKLKWASNSSEVLQKVLSLSEDEQKKYIERGLENVKRFDLEKALDKIEKIYHRVLNTYNK